MNVPAERSLPVRRRYLLLFLLGCLLYVPFLGARDMWYPDEPDIAEVGKAMYESGDWIAPRRVGTIWVDYPPMIYWTAAAAAHAFGGYSEFAFRLPTALAGVLLALITCAAGSRWYGPRAGLWAGFALLTSQQFVYNAVSYRPDVQFSLALAAGMFVYAAGALERPRLALRVAGFALLGVAMLAKGPLGLLLPGLVFTLWHAQARRWRRLFELAPLALVACAVYLPWFVACAARMGSDSILYELYAQNFQRFLSGSRGHGQPPWYYLVNFWNDLAPWAVLLPFAVWWIWRTQRRGDAHVRLALWWLGTFVVFLSLATTKRQLYLLPAYPAAVLLLAPWLDAVGRADLPEAERPSPRPAIAWGMVLGILLGVVGLILLGAAAAFEPLLARADLSALERATAPAVRLPLGALGLAMAAAGAWLARAARRGEARTTLLRIGMSQLPVYVVLMAWLFPAADPVRTFRPQGEWIRQQIGRAETHIGLLDPGRGKHKMGGFALYSGALVRVMRSGEEVEPFFAEHPGSLVLVQKETVGRTIDLDEERWRGRILRELQAGSDHYVVLGPP